MAYPPSGPQQPHYGPPPPYQPPKPGMSTGGKVGLGIGLGCGIPILLMIMLIGCAALVTSPSSDSTSSTAPDTTENTETDTEEPADESHPGLGDVVEHGDWEITVVSIERGIPTADLDQMFAEEPSGEWVVVEIDATNISSGPAYFDGGDQVLMDPNGSMYRRDISASDGLGSLDQTNPGGTTSGRLAYDVPEGVEIDYILVNGEGFLADGVRVDLD